MSSNQEDQPGFSRDDASGNIQDQAHDGDNGGSLANEDSTGRGDILENIERLRARRNRRESRASQPPRGTRRRRLPQTCNGCGRNLFNGRCTCTVRAAPPRGPQRRLAGPARAVAYPSQQSNYTAVNGDLASIGLYSNPNTNAGSTMPLLTAPLNPSPTARPLVNGDRLIVNGARVEQDEEDEEEDDESSEDSYEGDDFWSEVLEL